MDLDDRIEDAKDNLSNKAHEVKGKMEQKHADNTERAKEDAMEDDLADASDDW